jgi:UrcA family protein
MPVTILRPKSIVLGAALLLTTGGAALAQESSQSITINGHNDIHRETKIYGSPIRNVMTISISRGVNYADLDLSKDWGQYFLRSRIRDTAKELCREIDRQFAQDYHRVSIGDDEDCVRNAVRDGMAAAKVQIAASRAIGGSRVASLH